MSVSEIRADNIQIAAARVAEWTHRGGDVGDFYQHFLGVLPVPAGTIASIAWLCEPEAFKKLGAWSSNPRQAIQLPFNDQEHTSMLLRARDSADSQMFDAPAQADYGMYTENVLPLTAVVPVVVDGTARALIEVFLPPGLPAARYDEFRRDTEILCEIAGNFHRSSRPTSGGRGALPADVFKSLRVLDTCYALANESRRALDCDRVTILTAKGQNHTVRAVSGQEAVNRRANVVQRLERLTTKVVKTGQPFWYPVDAEKLPPEIEHDLERYIEEATCRRLGILPLSVREHEHDQLDDEPPPRDGEIYGALVVEDFTRAVDRDTGFQAAAQATAEEAAISLRNAVDHESIFLLPAWRFLGDQRRRFFGTKRRLTLAVLTVVAAVALCAAIVKVPFQIASDGHLQPAVRRHIFAAIDGTVHKLHVNHGSQVQAGDILAELRNTEVDLALEKLRSQIRQSQARLAALRTAQLSALDAHDDKGMSAAAEAAELERLLVSLNEQLTIQKQRKAQLQVASPIAGEVITWNLEDRLSGRPVAMGQSLMKVAHMDGPWRLELNLPDRRMAHLLKAQSSSEQPLEVSFILASNPGKRFTGRVQEVAKATRVDPAKGQNLLVVVEIDDPSLECRRAGTGVQAKVNCGRRSVGYVWLHDIFEFVQARVLFRFS